LTLLGEELYVKHFVVTAAILVNDRKILCMQRNQSKYEYISLKYEFPGGKVEPDETLEKGLMRELHEEMDILVQIRPEDFFMTVEYQYPDFAITMHSYFVRVDTRLFTRKEHVNHIWLENTELLTLDWAPADLPIVHKLVSLSAFPQVQ
jgi:8-oxo-dGTP diphosphatase